MTTRNDYNRQVIEEFRANGGKVGGVWEGIPLLLLTTTGAKSGERRITPMGYIPDGDCVIVTGRSSVCLSRITLSTPLCPRSVRPTSSGNSRESSTA